MKTEKEEEKLKDKHRKDGEFTAPHPSHGKNMTSLLHSGRKAERKSQRVSAIGEYNNSERKPVNHISRKTNDIYTLKLSKARKNKREGDFKCLGSSNCDVMGSDVTVTEANGDVTILDVNKPIARKRYERKHSFVSEKGFVKSSLRVCSRTVTKITLILAIIISILGGLCNIKLPERKSPIDTSSSLAPSTSRDVLCFIDSSVLSILRESSATIIGINEGLCSCINKRMFLNDDKHIVRCAKVLQNTIMSEERGYVYSCEHMTQVHLFHNRAGVLSDNTVKGEGYW